MPFQKKSKNAIPAEIVSMWAVLEAEEEERRKATLQQFVTDAHGFCKHFFPGEVYAPDIVEVLDSVSKYPVTGVQSATSTGKTFIGARIAKWFIDTFSTLGTCEVYISAAQPADNLERLWSEFRRIETKYPALFPQRRDGNKLWGKVMEGEYRIAEKNFVDCIPIPKDSDEKSLETRFSGKHAEYMLFILDEANAIPEAVWKAIRGCMTSGIVVRLLFFYNPRDRNNPAYRRVVNKECNPVIISALNHPNVIEGRPVIPGAVMRRSVVAMTATMTRLKMEHEKFDPEIMFDLPDYLVGEVAMLDNGDMTQPLPPGMRVVENEDYCYTVLGTAPKTSALTLIPNDWIFEARQAYDLYVHQHGANPPMTYVEATKEYIINPSVMGYDVAETIDLNVTCNRWAGFPIFNDWAKTELTESEEKAAEIYKKYHAKKCNVDATGLGAGVAAHMRLLGCPGANAVKVSESAKAIARLEQGDMVIEHQFGILRDQLLWAVREWLRPGNGAMLPPESRLLQALYALTYRKNPRTLKIELISTDALKAILGHSPDHLFALAFTFAPSGAGWGFTVKKE